MNDQIEEIHTSFINGQKKQAIEQIKDFGEAEYMVLGNERNYVYIREPQKQTF